MGQCNGCVGRRNSHASKGKLNGAHFQDKFQNPVEELAVSSWIREIEKVLMEDDNFDHRVETQLVPNNDFLADLLVDSPPCSNNDVVGADSGDLHKHSQTHTDVNKDDPIAKK
ncbi:hypothetical protein PVK06_012550 [Gossypium arboreum]|uniref:Uncharacterized protein n=1 Tax=Gossypium arboreum TaxID=29729 RepID=A0ABR0QCK3_GOSAR|nr:hypothetical protein PVK06_012550 [Gossypium arboreum]